MLPTLLAQAVAVPSEVTGWLESIFKNFGPTGGVLAILAYSLRKFCTWLMPHAERLFEAYIERQRSVAASLEKLTDKSIEIQQKNADTLSTMNQKMQSVCMAAKQAILIFICFSLVCCTTTNTATTVTYTKDGKAVQTVTTEKETKAHLPSLAAI